ncbi:hypothetical protein [Arthrobacter woluwensis]|uniref:Uncharacterized protein n=1 Tax=Arthrobacter woluwensis TaxID=156980 RepID=A0A1H4I556_9MICC|nr:hypothetical protein [Arthrobacter woluwensis]SEB29050.1 hypothetical protein SAMN04489745_0042 [Arthrobacter woluwensis]SEC53682.1 hypothetical protein SAMN04489745_3119 [Arthrobacter woluwensis]
MTRKYAGYDHTINPSPIKGIAVGYQDRTIITADNTDDEKAAAAAICIAHGADDLLQMLGLDKDTP